ncbi:type II toxin-antitoxin system VapC family toxin [Planotetraspora sp. GP83]|uniref:type II toxin-antitoxin system VapC family toxin n=1 Tax=Planotetraspora sp. GP83 TaxID=3156264 RepID=UPI003518CE5F
MTIYLDTSALLKLAVREDESVMLEAWLRDEAQQGVGWATSTLTEVELPRAAGRADPESLVNVPVLLSGLTLIEMDAEIRRNAASITPFGLRTLDAIHLASALYLGRALSTLVTYDRRLADAARRAGVKVEAPREGDRDE